ncbi:MAG: hypothetical protein WC637_20100 [Victivallales bacterium]|jgi:hypothetical protein
MNNKTGFFRTLISVCSGTDVFIQLMKASCARAIFHFLLLCILCSSAAVALQYTPYDKMIKKYCGILYKEFGEVRFSPEGIFPQLNPDRARYQRIDENRIDYIPDRRDSALFNPSDSISERGVLWMPDSVVLWVKSGPDYYAMPLYFSFTNIPKREKFTGNPGEKIVAYAEKYSFPADKFKGQPPVNFLSIQGAMLFAMLLLVFANIFLSILFFMPVFSIFFAMVFFFTGKQDLPDGITFTNLLTIAIYASFPGIIIATLYYGLNLPFVDFQTVCLTGFLIYLLVVLNSLKKLKKPDPRAEGYGDGDDF